MSLKKYLNKIVKVKIDRSLGSLHPKHKFKYLANYGYVPNTKAPDGEEIDAYVLGINKPIKEFTGKCISIIHRLDDNDDKLVIVPENINLTDEQIKKATHFQEKYFKIEIIRPESFDIIDENNKILNIIKSREDVHENLKYWHRVTHIWIVNSKKQVLCQQRSFNKDANPGKWQSFFGGHLKSGETYEQNASQELKEELGININADNLDALYVRKSETAKHFAQVYILKLDKDISEFSFDDKEVEQVKWFNIKDLEQAIKKQEFCNSIDHKVIKHI